jgi:hypothetical protein
MQKWELASGATTADFANNELYNDSNWNAGNRFGMQNNSRAKPFSGSVDGLIR